MALPTTACPRTTPDDDALFARLRAGDEAAFDAVFRTWYTALVRFAERLIGDRALAEDVAQDVLLALWRRRESHVAEVSVQAWLFRAVRNRALNVIRHEGVVARSATRVATTFADPGRNADADTDADVALAEAELQVAIEAAVAALPPRCREVFLLSRRHGMRQVEIAARLGIGVKAVEANITRALRELRTQLAPWLTGDPHA